MTSPVLWTSEDAVAATGGETTDVWNATGVSIDTRTLEAGDLFVALSGDNRDAHAFVAAAFEKGAAAAMVTRVPDGLAEGGPLLIVKDTLAGLEALGRAARLRTGAKIVAVTGSVGKTSTKEALRGAFAEMGRVHAPVASYNNHWGVCLTLARMPADTEFGVFEIGMNHAGEIEPLSCMVRPHTAIITTVEPVHLANFKDVSEIARAKAEIFSGIEPEGTAILNADNPHLALLSRFVGEAGVRNLRTFGHSEGADVRLINVALHETCSCVAANICGQPVTFKIGAPGRHWVMNALAVMVAVHSVGGDLAKVSLALAGIRAPGGRGERLRVKTKDGHFTIIDESYNANPVSMAAALAVLGQADIGRHGHRIAIMGDMLEMGPTEAEGHADLAGPVKENRIDLVACCGPLMENLWRALPANQQLAYGASSDDLVKALPRLIHPGDVVMVKGSLGSCMKQLVEALQTRGIVQSQASG